jgi:hypothetical protein
MAPSFFGDEVLLTSKQVRELFGNCSEMWIARREREGPGFPRARHIGNREYWVLGELKAWRDAQPRFRTVEHERPLPPRPPAGRRWKKGDKVTKAAGASSTATSES